MLVDNPIDPEPSLQSAGFPPANFSAALRLAGAGLAVFPCQPAGEKAKSPMPGIFWRNQSSTDDRRLQGWLTDWPNSAVGIDLAKSGLLVIDCDRKPGKPDGVAAFAELIAAHGLPDGVPIVETPSGGRHFYFRQPEGPPHGNSTGALPAGIDVRGHGGFVIAPGCHIEAGRYAAAEGAPELVEAIEAGTIPVAPEWLMDCLRGSRKADSDTPATHAQQAPASAPASGVDDRSRAYAVAALDREAAEVANAPEGARNETLNKASFAVGTLCGNGALSPGKAAAALTEAARAAGLSAAEAQKTIASGLRAGMAKPRDPLPERPIVDTGALLKGEEQPPPDWPDPDPIPDGLKPVAAFNYDFMPGNLALWVADIAERMQCPPDYVGIPALVALGTALGRKIAMRPQRRNDWAETANFWCCIVGRPGYLKSPALEQVMKPLKRLEAEARKQHEGAMREHAGEVAILKLRNDEAVKKARDAIKKGMDPSGLLTTDEPQEPAPKRYVTTDSSYEKLGEILAANPQGVLCFRDELVSLLRTLDREESAAARGFYLTAWNGTSGYTFDRIIRGQTHIEAACLSMLGSTQPGRLADYIRRAKTGGAGDDGLIQRFGLLVWPDQSPEWREVDRWPDSAARQSAWATFEALDALDPATVGAEVDEYGDLPFLRFDDAGHGLFAEWRADLEAMLRAGDLPPALESHFSKYRKLVPGLALINHLADGHTGPVGEAATVRALATSEYLMTHARRAYASGSEAEAATAKMIVRRIKRGDLRDGFTARELWRNQWGGLDDLDAVKAGLVLLVDLHWLAAETGQTGGRPRTTFTINPKVKP